MANEDKYWEMITRQMPLVDEGEQEKFKSSKIAVIGCGGIGGQTIEMLARMGVGELILVDEDSFDWSNLNRQTLSTTEDIGLGKSEVAKHKIEKINPYVKVKNFTEHVDASNIDEILKDADIVIDALDNILTRVIVSRKARENKIPFIHGAIHGTLGQITVFLSNTKSYEEMFGLPSDGKQIDDHGTEHQQALCQRHADLNRPAALQHVVHRVEQHGHGNAKKCHPNREISIWHLVIHPLVKAVSQAIRKKQGDLSAQDIPQYEIQMLEPALFCLLIHLIHLCSGKCNPRTADMSLSMLQYYNCTTMHLQGSDSCHHYHCIWF